MVRRHQCAALVVLVDSVASFPCRFHTYQLFAWCHWPCWANTPVVLPLAQHNTLSRPRWALYNHFLIDDLRAMGITTASPFSRIPSTTLRQSCTSKYGTAHTGVSCLSAGHPSNTNFITDCRLASNEVAWCISSSRYSGMSLNTLTFMIRARTVSLVISTVVLVDSTQCISSE